MNAEHLQQLYGGEISDHFLRTNNIDLSKVSHGHDCGKDLSQIYNAEVKSKGSINTNGLVDPNVSLNGMIERTPDPFQSMLNSTLTKIAKEIGLEGEPGMSQALIPDLLKPKNQTQDDIHRAQDAVATALAELKNLGAL